MIRDRAFYRNILRLSLPAAFQALMSLVVVMADNVMVASLDPLGLSLAAVSQSNAVTNFVNASLTGLAGGGVVLVAQYWGKRDMERIKPVCATIVTACLGLALVVSLLVLMFPSYVLRLVISGKEREITALALQYHDLRPERSLAARVGLDTADDADWTVELKTGSADTAMSFAKRELHPHPAAKRILVSTFLLNNAVLPVDQIVRDQLSYKFGITQEKAFLAGSGSGQPLGVFTASSNGIDTDRDVSTGNTTTAIGADGLINAKYALKGQYQRTARWIFHRDAISGIRKLKDGDGQYLWQPGLVADKPDTILGLQFFISEYAPNTFTTGKYAGILGDFSFYWIADSMEFSIQVLKELYAESNQIGYIGRMECDGQPVLSEAFVRVKLA
mgnify:CR=1 FL=1